MKRKMVTKEKMILTVACVCLVSVLATLSFMAAGTTSAVEAQEKGWNLKLVTAQSEKATEVKVLVRWAEALKKRTAGRMDYTLYPDESLVKRSDMVDGVKKHVCDVVILSSPNYPGQFPILDVVGIPFLTPGQTKTGEVLNTLYYKGLLKELDPFKVLWFNPTIAQGLMFRSKKFTTLNDFKGQKIRAPGGFMLPMLKAFGATPVSFAAGEVYMALDRRIVDGVTTSPDSAFQNKLYEVAKYWLDLPIYGGGQFVAMNLDLWNSLPSDIKVIIQELNAEAYYEKLDANSLELVNIMATVQKAGVTIYKIAPEEEVRWEKAGESIVDDYIKQMEAKGLPGREVVEIARRVSARVSR